MTAPEQLDGPRACTKYEVGAALDLMNLVFSPQAPEMGSFNPLITSEANAPRMRILRVNGVLVAHAGYWVYDYQTSRGMLKLGGLWAVATHPDYRRRGYGRLCVLDAMRALREEGCQLGWLATGINDWYRALGWENGGEDWTFTVDRFTVNLLPEPDAEVRFGLWPDTAAMLARYHAPGIGVRRSREWFDVLLRRHGLRCATASRHGALLAYVLYKGMHVYEQAGEAACIPGLLRAVFLREDDRDKPTSTSQHLDGMLVRTCPSRDGFATALINLGLPRTRAYNGMWWIPDPPALLNALDLADITVTEAGGTITLRRGDETARLSSGEVVKLLLGPERVAAFAGDLLPIRHYLWRFDGV
ncbi:MAG: Acetyltransferase (GNAT) family protein [bacterium ADurb.Bin429]|nr:MAG: Acetyltransferase (GNAT) family protein [bacterium ADurb.Bin429]